jgi:nicotinate-nucleotide pyrophosphorylase (carboxylating)
MIRRSLGEGGPIATGGLSPEAYTDVVRRALEEDRGRGDATSAAVIKPGQRARGVILAKSDLVVAGLDVAAETFRQLDAAVVIEVLWADGSHVGANEPIAFVTGDASALLTAERTALNFLQRMSGIATLTATFVTAAAGRITILDTRKTTPGLRVLEKYAVRCGGGTNHRHRLDDGILIKDNHKRLAGGVGHAAIAAMKSANGLPVEVEVENLAELDELLATGVPRILLDNFPTHDIREAVTRVNGRAQIEISGGVTLERIPELATTGADFVSVGALTHSAPAADLSFELEPA